MVTHSWLIRWALAIFAGAWLSTAHLAGREFTVLVYNVENLFDVDGVALFDDYKSPDEGGDYTPRKLLTKIENVTTVLKQFNDGAGPEIIAFQEFELDRTPESTVEDYAAFAERFADLSLADMLLTPRIRQFAGTPVEALLYKHLIDSGLPAYNVAVPDVDPSDVTNKPAHNNVTFSRFPIVRVVSHPTPEARDILEVEVSVDGTPFTLFNNHWKSGASSPEREIFRVRNAFDLRRRLNGFFERDPSADAILVGDFNAHYNQVAMVEGLTVSGIGNILGSHGYELDQIDGEAQTGQGFYNLWYELPISERGSEIWGGRWSTLMHIMLARGLYDQAGIQYVDNSFGRAKFIGLNASDNRFGAPRAWVGFGETGQGFSDHLPVYARFRTVDEGNTRAFMDLVNPSLSREAPAETKVVDYASFPVSEAKSWALLRGVSDEAVARFFGSVFAVRADLGTDGRQRAVTIGERTFYIWSFSNEVIDHVRGLEDGQTVTFLGELSEYRGNVQFVVRDPAWWFEPDLPVGEEPGRP